MRIGTWNLAGRWGPAHLELLVGMDCDVLLLTEVNNRLELPSYVGHVTDAHMAAQRRWAGVFARSDVEPLPDPHPASAMARVDGITFCSSILPWNGCGQVQPWGEGNLAARTERTVACLLENLPTAGVVWGGDFNHALRGRVWAGSKVGRLHILATMKHLGLAAPTTSLPHQKEAMEHSIDHIAVPAAWRVTTACRVSALTSTGRLSDHDAYVVEVSVGAEIRRRPT